jgi:folate-binding Fe-S cluster repair protein YgfZ
MSEQHRVITKLIPTTHNDNILLECDQLLLDASIEKAKSYG